MFGAAKSQKNRIKGVALIVSVACGFAALSCNAPPERGDTKPTLVVLTIGYPHLTGVDSLHGLQQGARLLSLEGLVSLGRDGKAQPRLAASWSYSLDGLSLTVRLRNNAFFHDGSPVDSQSVRQSLERSLKTADRDFSPGLADIVRIENPTPNDIVIHLRERSNFALDDLTVPIVKTSSQGQIGTGPFVTTSTAASEIVMTAVENYYRGKPGIDRIEWKAYPAVRTAWAAMMRGEVDFLYEVGPDAVEFTRGESSVNVFPFLRSYVYGVILNSKQKQFSDWRVRRALNYAVDRSAIVTQALKGHGIAAPNAAWPQHWAFDSSLPEYSYDPARAVALLDSAGVPPASNRGKDAPPSRLSFSCLVPEGFDLWERMALLTQKNLAQIGVQMDLESVSFPEFNRRIGTGDFEAVVIEFVAGNTASRAYTFWYSSSKRNVWGYRNPELDNALDEIRTAADETTYRKAFSQFQTVSVDDPPAIFLALGEVTRAVSKRFHVVAAPGTDIISTIADWQLVEPATRTTN